MFSFTNQNAKNAVVPLMSGRIPAFFEQYQRGTLVPDEVSTAQHKQNWNAIYGVYKYDSADTGKVEYVEAQMLLSNYWHDFCGGLMASSAAARTRTGVTYRLWGDSAADPHLLVRPASYFCKRSYLDTLPVPSIQQALRSKDAITAEIAEAIMERSLIMWACSELIYANKRGMLGYDKAPEEDEDENYGARLRNTMKQASGLSWVPNSPLRRPDRAAGMFLELYEAPGLSRTPYEPWLSHGSFRKIECTPQVDEGRTWVNRNSARLVGPVQVFLDVGDLDYTEVYSEEDDEYYDVVVEGKPLGIPEWYKTAANNVGYYRLWPLEVFHNN